MKKLLFVSILLLLAQSYDIKPFEVEDTDLFESQCSGEWCSPVTLPSNLQKKYKSCNYFAKNNEIKCTEHNGEIKTIKVYSSDKTEINNKNFIGTYKEKRGNQFVEFNLYEQAEKQEQSRKRKK